MKCAVLLLVFVAGLMGQVDVGEIKRQVSATLKSAEQTTDLIDKRRMLEETTRLSRKLVELRPQEFDGYEWLGVSEARTVEAEFREVRLRIGMKGREPGPLADLATRQEMRVRFEGVIEDGIRNIQKARRIANGNPVSMDALSALLRARADIRDTTEEALKDIGEAEKWEIQAANRRRASLPSVRVAEPTGVRLDENVAARNLVSKVEPVYPEANVQGTVRFTAVIGKDGRISNLTLISGHPLLVAAALAAVQQWVYRPTLLNGSAVDVITTISVEFVLPSH